MIVGSWVSLSVVVVGAWLSGVGCRVLAIDSRCWLSLVGVTMQQKLFEPKEILYSGEISLAQAPKAQSIRDRSS